MDTVRDEVTDILEVPLKRFSNSVVRTKTEGFSVVEIVLFTTGIITLVVLLTFWEISEVVVLAI